MNQNPIDVFYRPQTLIENRVYLFIVKHLEPVPVVFLSWFDEEKRLVNISLFGVECVLHASCVYMTKLRIKEGLSNA
ncbi:hypothetical protein GOV14_03535 [Candidatus Pacearchaeota archaeon]|nr:hypothetical protein [Candidatus Pacearchaeota archaeon]